MQETWHVRSTYFLLAPLNRLYPGADELFSCLGRTQLQILNTKKSISVIKVLVTCEQIVTTFIFIDDAFVVNLRNIVIKIIIIVG
jgi:hypothetical protein